MRRCAHWPSTAIPLRLVTAELGEVPQTPSREPTAGKLVHPDAPQGVNLSPPDETDLTTQPSSGSSIGMPGVSFTEQSCRLHSQR